MRVTIGIFLALAALLLVPAAGASILQASVVSQTPAGYTPNVVDDAMVPNAAVYALAQSHGVVYAGGSFDKVSDSTQTVESVRQNIMAFDAATGDILPFAPTFDGAVWAIQPRGASVYVGGDFTHVNGTPIRGLVKLDATSGAIRSNFLPPIPSGNVTEIRIVSGRLIVGGSFPERLAALRTKTGSLTNYIQAPVSGRLELNSGPTKVYRFAVNPAGTRLVAVGNFTTVGGEPRSRAFMLRLGANKAVVSKWYYQPLRNSCRSVQIPSYLRDVDFSPSGGYFVIVATGFVPKKKGLGRDICDAAARFETKKAHPGRPTWINYTGGDTLESVAVTGAAVYVQGHQRWLDNPDGRNTAGPGAVPRPGIGAINPATGLALGWNPTKSREVGGMDFLATEAGLWVGSDGNNFAGQHHDGIAFLPLP